MSAEQTLDHLSHWAAVYDGLIARIKRQRFGHVIDYEISLMDVLLYSGTVIQVNLGNLMNSEVDVKNLNAELAKLTSAIKSLQFLHRSYKFNLSNDELDRIAKEASP